MPRCSFIDRYLQWCQNDALEGKQHCHMHTRVLDGDKAAEQERAHWEAEGQKQYDPLYMSKPKVWERPFDDVQFQDTQPTEVVDLDAVAAEQAELEREFGIS